ncbi:zinc-dependent alcohol dehydrogenase family protein [Pseudomonas chlororaphis]|uniref:zinc-dependent alcohol dehydrogenase family protein n=1 Tax=Pseudomonas chlororaphis TaxID=587753 RepID=UPI00209BB1FC|nr:zinc-dependent alcohol dehydrogenase family protein [Pseudomonas chlororaphis]MCO7573000.1 zinc-dependent alcohol dehydrogenase family protein [Pseudomonas chlororaphis]MCO7591410.1 zinc-dependent alcohol dehydrogenase family protein [Pseudomonas chlororaphis]MCO7613972.1 zinc-dependent alcohol dehydrogenase family protein [Pseudomonas chlororaphis]
MHAMVLNRIGSALQWTELPDRQPGPGEVRIRVTACGVCRTDLHVLDGELADPQVPIIPGHEVVGRIDAIGAGVVGFGLGERVGVPWLGHTCGRCSYCLAQRENLCDQPRFTGYTRDGGFATSMIADAAYVFALGEQGSDASLAPLLCAGLIGWRALLIGGEGQRLGLYGFGAAAHIVAQVALWQGRSVFAFTRARDTATQTFARQLGATWAGDSNLLPPEPLDVAIIFAPDGALVPKALQAVRKGGRVVCAGIHMSRIPAFAYDLLWGERALVSVANLTRQDGIDFLRLAAQIGVVTHTTLYPLTQANQALEDLRAGAFEGAAVLVPDAALRLAAPFHDVQTGSIECSGGRSHLRKIKPVSN